MLFLILRNNKNLYHKIWHTSREFVFAAFLALLSLIIIMGFDIDTKNLGSSYNSKFNITLLPSVAISILSMIASFIFVMTQNKSKFGLIRFRYMFEILFLIGYAFISIMFFIHLYTPEILNIILTLFSMVIILSSLGWSIWKSNYSAETIIGIVKVRTISFNGKRSYLIFSLFISLAWLSQLFNIMLFWPGVFHIEKKGIYALILQWISIFFYFLSTIKITKSGKIGISRGSLFYRSAQLSLSTIFFLSVGIICYVPSLGIKITVDFYDYLFLGLGMLPFTSLMIRLYHRQLKLRRDPFYQGFLEFKNLSNILFTILFQLLLLILSIEVKFYTIGEQENNIYIFMSSICFMLLTVIIPFLLFWKKITKSSSVIMLVVSFLLIPLIIYKFFYFADIQHADGKLIGLPYENLYTIFTALLVVVILSYSIFMHYKDLDNAYKRYSDSIEKGVMYE